MKYKEQLYKNALKVVEDIYNESKYNLDVDLYRSLDVIQSLSDNQFNNKQWLIDNLVPIMNNMNQYFTVGIFGGWYGLLSAMLREHLHNETMITNIDTDPMSMEIGYKLLNDPIYERNHFIVDDALDHMIERGHEYSVIINTSCEHMERDDVRMMVKLKQSWQVICFQSNNYDSVTSHTNTSKSLEEFVEYLDLIDVMYADKLVHNDYERYMVIGK